MSAPGGGSLRFLPQLQMRTGALGVTGDESLRQASRKLHGDWIFLRKHEWVSGLHHNSRGTPNFLPQLRKKPEILPSTARDEALSHYGISRKPTFRLVPLKGHWLTLEATQSSPAYPSTPGYTSVHHNSRNPVFPPHFDM